MVNITHLCSGTYKKQNFDLFENDKGELLIDGDLTPAQEEIVEAMYNYIILLNVTELQEKFHIDTPSKKYIPYISLQLKGVTVWMYVTDPIVAELKKSIEELKIQA